MTYTTDLTTGLAQLLAAESIGDWSPAGVYTTDQTGITIAAVPASPDRIICLTPYPVEDGPLTATTTAVQARLRAGRDPRDVLAIADQLHALLHFRRHYEIGGVHVDLSWRQSQAWIGLDSNGRQEITANYYFRAENLGAPNLDD